MSASSVEADAGDEASRSKSAGIATTAGLQPGKGIEQAMAKLLCPFAVMLQQMKGHALCRLRTHTRKARKGLGKGRKAWRRTHGIRTRQRSSHPSLLIGLEAKAGGQGQPCSDRRHPLV